MLELTVNGQLHRFDGEMSVADLMSALGLAGKRCAVERNGEIVPRGMHATTLLHAGDKLEVVVAVGGG
ncbi:sulfur carrier protein ThiS [Parachitinimonas caeni]|uniref:Sulfur carrier protein ThiS n=1 Tax=Parachitinimonas caeni TaxID=3031301 RepID=A0ABT7DT59_9NEIS|nr:sulfur carrier protein ThiS [Parachitinimonas caeni]MDK2123253.1 sulfur carrier protein ThiS [Parachitinimonas caeni]